MRIPLGLIALSLAGCALSAASDPAESQQSQQSTQSATTAQAVPRTTGSFLGHYVVPAPPDLADAALFAMPEVDWSVSRGIATLHYELPLGLVGGDLPVTLTGPCPSGATSVQLSSTNGSGTCTAQGSKITCSESLANLGALPISQAVVVQVAAVEYPGPASDRTAVANFFSSDPIGTIDFDISKPAPDDDDGGHGGGGGHGPH